MSRSLDSYRLLLTWRMLQLRTTMPVIVVLEVVLAVGIVYGFAFLIPDIDATTAAYLCTGAPTLVLILAGLAIVPQEVTLARRSGGYDYMRSLPVPWLANMFAEITVWVLAQIPGTFLALLVGALRFHFTLRISVLVVPIALLVGVTSAAIGYALAAGLPPPLVSTISQFTSILLLLFSPIDFPLSRLPAALQDIHHALPVTYMADLMRWSLTGVAAENVGTSFAVVAVWCSAALLVCRRVAMARG